MNAPEAREDLDATVRRQLYAAFRRGIDTGPHGPGALYDKGAPEAFEIISIYADSYAKAIAARWRGPDDGVPADTPADGDAR